MLKNARFFSFFAAKQLHKILHSENNHLKNSSRVFAKRFNFIQYDIGTPVITASVKMFCSGIGVYSTHAFINIKALDINNSNFFEAYHFKI